MSLQSKFDNQALQMLPKVWVCIQDSKDSFCRSQMISVALREISNFSTCLDEMSAEEIAKADEFLVDWFIRNEWI